MDSTTTNGASKEAAHTSHNEVIVTADAPTFGFATWKQNLSTFKNHKRVSFWCISVLLFLVNFGFDSMISGQALAFQAFREDYGHYYAAADDYVVSATWQSLWAAANTLGIVIGSCIAGFTNDRIGRKFSFWVNLLTSVVTSFILLFAPNVQTLFAAKLIFGIAIGMSYTTAPLYVVENAPTEIRGTLMSFFNTFVVLGQFLAVGIANPLSTIHGSWSYKGTFCLTFLIPAILVFIIPFLPESPYFYLMKGRDDDARKALLRLHGPDIAHDVDRMVQEIKASIGLASQEHEDQPRWVEIFQGTNLRRTVLLVVIYSLHHCSGMPFVIPYQTYFYQLSGVGDAFAVALGAFALMLGGNFGALILPGFVGQRKMMVFGAALLIIWDIIIGCTGFAPKANTAAMTASVAFVASWAFIYQLTIGTIGFVVAPEIPSQRLRAKTQSFGTIVGNILGWAVAFSIPYLFNPDKANLGAKLLFIFVGLGTPLVIYLWWNLPETKNRTLAELDEIFEGHGRLRDVERVDKADLS
ncbi:general substrate transporter [Dactylonectria estremocensis]|uniref:General substrate transporter n=1 Tax=Dactylonectria estremocensis TaxID=1079267 RepID=A0A9P9E206_9HYPO|nr:general substrate transporter [Dactylonectria estremocensis]